MEVAEDNLDQGVETDTKRRGHQADHLLLAKAATSQNQRRTPTQSLREAILKIQKDPMTNPHKERRERAAPNLEATLIHPNREALNRANQSLLPDRILKSLKQILERIDVADLIM